VTGPDERQRRALTALSFLADPGDRALGGLLRSRTATEILAAITVQDVPELVTRTARRDLPGLASTFGRRRAPLGLLPTQVRLAAWERAGLRLTFPGDPEWPRSGTTWVTPWPLLLWVRGSVDLRYACLSSVSVVGSRAATGYGSHVGTELGAALAERGFTVVSGGAYGLSTVGVLQL